MAATAAIISAVAAVAGTGTGIAASAGAFGKPGAPPRPPTGPTTPDLSQLSKAILPQAKADAAARVGGGISPDFLSSLVDQGTGNPGGSLGILDDIRKSIGSEAP